MQSRPGRDMNLRETRWSTLVATITISVIAASGENYNPCCSFPCQNRGICSTKGFDSYVCDCTRTGYYGENCEYAIFSTKIYKLLKPSPSTVQHLVTNYKFVWDIINGIYSLRKLFMGAVLSSNADYFDHHVVTCWLDILTADENNAQLLRVALVAEPTAYIGTDEYTSMDTYLNKTVYARSLPPIPENCPLPMGVVGPKTLPDPEEFAERFHLRKRFRPCPRRTNLLFPMFAQHFNHQYFKTDVRKGLPFQWGNQMVDISHIYGDTHELQNALRTHIGGKMKVSNINGEDFPPRMSDVSYTSLPKVEILEQQNAFVFGHTGFGFLPSFLIFSTIWLREHNRVCDILMKEHPEWKDERLYQTARLIILGETIKIIVEDYVQHLSGFNYNLLYDPEVMMGKGLSHHNQIHLEFHTLYHWHPLVPDIMKVGGKNRTLKDLLFNPDPVVDAGMAKVLKEFNTQIAGAVAGGRNQGAGTLAVAIQTIKDGRKMRLQPFNNYRRQFGLKPYTSFEEFTGETEMAAELRDIYKDIEALELYNGLILEKRRPKQLFGETLTEMGAPYSLKGLYGNPIGSPSWWKPVTFGGEAGMDIIKHASLEKLICDNVAGCPKVAFRVPDGTNGAEDSQVALDDDTSHILMKCARDPVLCTKTADSKQTCDKSDPHCDL